MDPVIVIQNDDPEPNDENDATETELAFTLGALVATVETLASRVSALEVGQSVTAVVADAAQEAAQEAADAAQEAADAAQEAADVAEVLTEALDADDAADDEFMPALDLSPAEPDVPAEKPHPLFRSWNDWKA